MLDGSRYFAEFPDEEPVPAGRPLVSDELLKTLAAIEKEISAFIRARADDGVAAESDPAPK
jgi:hypothetical protein